MEIFNPNNSVPTITEPFPEVKDYLSLDLDTTGRSEPASFGSPSPIPESAPVSIGITAGDRLFPGQIQEAIAGSPPEPLPPPSPAPADPLIGNSPVLNQEAIASLGQPGNGVKVEYYDRADFTSKVLTRIDPKIDFDWGDGSPDEAIGSDTFSARWTGKIQPAFTETYTLYVRSHDGVRLWVHGELAIDAWSNEGSAEYSSTIALEAGQLYDFTLEYAENTGNAAIELLWSSASQPQQTIPTSALYTSETTLSPEPEAPEPLQFHTNSFYSPEDNVKFRGLVFVGDRDLEKIDFRLQKDGGEWVDISDATELEASDDPDYAFFNYQLSDLEPGQYQLQGLVIDDPQTSFTESFTVLSLPQGTDLPDSVLHAIARAANPENYSAEALAGTQQWVVNLRVGEDAPELATALGVRDLGPTGHIPNSFIWEFPANVNAMDTVSQLDGLQAVQFFYPLISVKLEPLFTPNDPLFDRQWHLKNTGQTKGRWGVDANVTGAWESATGQGVAIAIVDDGLQHNHPDLRGNYRPDLSRDLNEGDLDARNYDDDPVPFSQGLTFQANLENPLQFWEIPPLYVDLEGVVANVKLTLDSDHPLPSNLQISLESPSETELELIPGDNSNEYIIDADLLDNESSLGAWTLIVEDDSEISGQLRDWSLTLDIWNSHGTAVAGVAAASGNNNLGVTGVAPDAELAGLRLIAAERVNPIQMADALYSELNQEIDIYNNSWKPPVFWSVPEALSALETGVTAGRDGLGNIYVFGAGNNAGLLENVNYNAFANSRYTIAVGAINHSGKRSGYSQEGASLLVSAPSSNDNGNNGSNKVGITTTDLVGSEGYNVYGQGKFGPNYRDLDYTNDFGGTSSATPVVSGVVALMLEVNPDLTWRDVQHILVETANRDLISESSRKANWSGGKTDEIRHSHRFGFGVVDAEAAVNAAANWTSVPKEVSISTGVSSTPHFSREIPDGDRKGVTDSITLESDITVEWVEVVFDADHELRSDLRIELTSPSGTKSLLAFPWIEFSDAGYDNWVLTSVRHWGESSLGEWELRVVDPPFGFSDEAGTWNSWELNFYGTKPTVSLEVTEPDASEDGDVGSFTVTRTGNTDNPLIVNYSSSGTATAGEDYEALTETVVIPAGEDSVTVAIEPIDDDEVEGNETVFFVIDADDAYDIGTNNSATVTIADNDFPNNPPTLTGISLLTGAKEETSFTISYSDLMAKSDATDADGDPIALQISTIASGTLIKNDVPVEPGITTLSEDEVLVWTPDTVGDEVAAFAVRAFDGTDYSAQVQVNVAVAALPVVTISATDANASESGDAGEFAVTRSGDTTESLEVSYSTAGNASASSDYSEIGNIVIPAGSSEVKVSLDPIDDEEIEGSETVVLNLSAGTGYKLGEESSATVTIADNDFANNPPTLTGIELLTGAKEETSFTISYSDLMAKSDATDADGDPIALQISTIASGTLIKNDVPVEPGVTILSEGEAVVWTPDTVGDEVAAFAVRAFDGTDYSAQVQVNVAVAALPVVTISATDANASESGDAGEFAVTRSGDTTSSLSVSFSIAGNASAGSDYSEIGPIVIPAGSSEVTVSLDPIDDEEIEGSETVVLNLEASTGYLVGEDRSGSVLIADNDSENHAPTMTNISIPTCIASDESLTISYADLLNASDATDVDGDAISFAIEEVGSEGTLTFNGQPVIPGETVLSEGSNLIWTPNTAGDSVPAFTVSAIDGKEVSSSVEVTIHVLEKQVIDEDKILSDAVEIRFTDIKAVEDDPEGDKFQFQFEVLNWTNQPAEGLRFDLNVGNNSSVQDAAPMFVDAQIDKNGTPLGDDADPLPGNQFFVNAGTVQESTSTAIQWKTRQFDLSTFQSGPIPNKTPVILSNAETIDDGNNVLDGFVFTVDDFDELEALSFNWNLFDENNDPIGTFGSEKSYGFGTVIMTRSECQHSPTFELSNANSSQSDRVQNRFFTKEYRVKEG